MKKYFQERKRIFYLVSPALIGAIFLIACFVNINQSITIGESYSMYLTRFDFGKITELASANACPPFFLFVLKIWAHFFGYNVFTMRALATIFGAIAIVFAFLWLKYKHGTTIAIVSSFMMAISPALIHFGQEMTMQTMLLAIAFAATFFLQLAIDNHKKTWWIIYIMLVIVGMLTHYVMAFVWIAHLVYLISIYGKKILNKKFIYIYILPLAMYIPWMFSPAYGQAPELSISSITNLWTQSILYEQSGGVTNWLLIPFIVMTAILLILAVRYGKKFRMLSSLIAVPTILAVLLSLPPFKSMFATNLLLPTMVAFNILAGALIVTFAREKFAKKRKKSKKFALRHPDITVCVVCIIVIVMPIVGMTSVYRKGNYNFETGKKSTISEVFDNIIALDRLENLSIIAASADIYYELSAYGSYHHDVNFIADSVDYNAPIEPLNASYFGRISNIDKFLENRDAIWYVGIAPDEGHLEFPRANWRISTYANVQFDDDGYCYQILKLEKE